MFVFVYEQFVFIVDWNDFELSVCLFVSQLLRYNIGVVFYCRNYYFVVFFQVFMVERRSNQINIICCIFYQNIFFCVIGIQEVVSVFLFQFVGIGCLLIEFIYIMVYIGILMFIVMIQCIQYLLWFLVGSSIIEKYEWFVVYFIIEQWEISLDCIDIVGRFGDGIGYGVLFF